MTASALEGGVVPALRSAMLRLLSLGGVDAASGLAARSRIHYLDTDPAARGRPLVLVHGGGGGCANWYRLLAPLSRGRRVLAPDLPGFGLSPAVEPRAPLGVQGARLLLDWLDELGVGELDLLGTSFGGLVALRLAHAAPGRVRRLAVLDSAGLGRAAPLLVRVAAQRWLRALTARPSRSAQAWLLDRLVTAGRAAIPGEHREALIDYLWLSAAAQPRALPAALSHFVGLRGQVEVLDPASLRRQPAATLVVWGERDRFFPLRHGARMAAAGAARLAVVAGSGHSPNWEAPERLLDLLAPFFGGADR